MTGRIRTAKCVKCGRPVGLCGVGNAAHRWKREGNDRYFVDNAIAICNFIGRRSAKDISR